MNLPCIGLTTSRIAEKNDPFNQSLPFRQIIAESYTQAVQRAGGIPLLLPFKLDSYQIEKVVSRLDGVMLSGGGDIAPERFNGQPHPAIDLVDPVRDDLELELVRCALRMEKPVLGICRGLQVLNVALGGTLYTDLHDQFSDQIKHPRGDDFPRNYRAHKVQVKSGSLLGQVVKQETLEVNSLHHQGIERLAPGLVASAYAPDGLIEAVEWPEYLFCLAVQWHPECLPETEESKALFKAFIRVAGGNNSNFMNW